ncbi:MAG: AmmeMemoRadiSam system protein A [Rectinema sp.]
MDFSISLDDQKKLLKYARDVIRASLYHQGKPEAPTLSTTLRCGAFVTLKEAGSLRGCIGRMQSDDPLVTTVSEMAYAAAFEDPRFPPLRKEEMDLITIEITVLSPLRPIAPEEVVIGKHGLLISAFGRSGVLLPQVPVEYGWDRETFLEQVCRKAGLPADAWKSSRAMLYGFEGFVFSES